MDDTDDDVLVHEVQHEIINLSEDEDDDDFAGPSHRPQPALITRFKTDPDERQRAIKTEILNQSDDDDTEEDNDDIVLIDDDFDDDLAEATGAVADTSLIDDIFGTDTLLADFNQINDAMPDQPREEQIITCPICTERMCRDVLDDHLNGCQGIKMTINKRQRVAASTSTGVFRKSAAVPQVCSDRQLLADAGYTISQINAALGEGAEEAEYNGRIEREMRENRGARRTAGRQSTVTAATVQPVVEEEELAVCPVCSARIGVARMNDHLDVCLSASDLVD